MTEREELTEEERRWLEANPEFQKWLVTRAEAAERSAEMWRASYEEKRSELDAADAMKTDLRLKLERSQVLRGADKARLEAGDALRAEVARLRDELQDRNETIRAQNIAYDRLEQRLAAANALLERHFTDESEAAWETDMRAHLASAQPAQPKKDEES